MQYPYSIFLVIYCSISSIIILSSGTLFSIDKNNGPSVRNWLWAAFLWPIIVIYYVLAAAYSLISYMFYFDKIGAFYVKHLEQEKEVYVAALIIIIYVVAASLLKWGTYQ